MQVEYRDIQGFPGYRVGNDGTVWSCWTQSGVMTDIWHQMKNQLAKMMMVGLHREGKQYPMRVGVLVLNAFIGPRPEGLECCHGDGDSSNNHTFNLRWDTHKSNMEDMVRHGRSCRGEKSAFAKLTDRDVLQIRELNAKGVAISEIAPRFGVNPATVSRVVSGKKWSHVPGEIPHDKRFSRFTEAEVVSIRVRLSQGESLRSLSKAFSVARDTIKAVRDGAIAACA